MGLAQTIFNSIKQNYFSVWDIISLIEQKTNNDLFDVGLFLGHINIEEHTTIYQRDKFYNLHEIDLNFNRNPLGEIIDCLMNIMPFDSDEEQQDGRIKVRSKSDKLFFAKQDIYNFKPIMDLGIIAKPPTQVITVQSVQESRPDKYKFFLYKQPLFSIDECACIISDYDPLEIQKYPCNDIDEIAPDYSRAYSFVNSAIEAGKINRFNYKVDAREFRNYLISENIIIAGFNDYLKNGVAADQSQDEQNSMIDQLKKENAKLKGELLEKDQKIKELELIQTSIVDESKLGSTRAENNAAKLILALSELASIDVSKPYAPYDSLKTQGELLGMDKFPSNENVATWLKRANAQKS